MLTIKQVSKRYGELEAVKNIDLMVKPGQILGFLGPNGAGKTTTIKMCCGLLLPDKGEINVCGFDIQGEAEKAKQKIGYVPDEPFLYDQLTGKQFLNFIGEIYQVPFKEKNEKMNFYLEHLDLVDKVDELIGSYSRGMKRKIALIAGILHSPRVLLLDEPTLGLDAMSAKKVKDLIKKIAHKEEVSVLLTTHVMEIAEHICDEIAVISKGKIIAKGNLEDLKLLASNQGSLEDVFVELTKSGDE